MDDLHNRSGSEVHLDAARWKMAATYLGHSSVGSRHVAPGW